MSAPYDEAYDERGEPRPHYADVLAALGDPAATATEVKRRLTERGVTFAAAPGGVFALDPVPRIVTEAEWSELQAGIGQRLLALEAFVADVYGEGRVFDAGLLDRADVEASGHYEPAMRGASPARWISFAGLDVARCEDGRFRVIEDNARMAAGLAYTVAARETLLDLIGVEPPQHDLCGRAPFWHRCSRRSPRSEGRPLELRPPARSDRGPRPDPDPPTRGAW